MVRYKHVNIFSGNERNRPFGFFRELLCSYLENPVSDVAFAMLHAVRIRSVVRGAGQ